MSEPWPIHTIVFDLDDTLYRESDFVRSGFFAADAWLRRERGIHGFLDPAQRLFAAGQRGTIFNQVLAEVGVLESDALVRTLIAVYREHEPALSLEPEAEAVLAWSENRFRLALITDGFAAVQARKIRALGLDCRIACRIITDEMGREFWKPHPAAFRRVMEALPGPADGFVYVADNPRKDFIAPRELGWRTLRLRRPGGEHSTYEASENEAAEREVASLAELPSCFRAVQVSR